MDGLHDDALEVLKKAKADGGVDLGGNVVDLAAHHEAQLTKERIEQEALKLPRRERRRIQKQLSKKQRVKLGQAHARGQLVYAREKRGDPGKVQMVVTGKPTKLAPGDAGPSAAT